MLLILFGLLFFVVTCSVLEKHNKRNTMQHPLQNLNLSTLLMCPHLVAGDIEVQEYEKIYRGPIESVSLHGWTVHFDLVWCAYYDLGTDRWTAADHKVTVIIDKRGLQIMGRQDCLRYVMTSDRRDFIVATIDVRGGAQLDPADVIDLDLHNLPKAQVVRLG